MIDDLPPRQKEVLECMARGLLNKQIAWEMKISEKTVRNRLTGILAVLGVADRVQAALLARDKGLLGPPTS